MNLYSLDSDPRKSAMALSDAHVKRHRGEVSRLLARAVQRQIGHRIKDMPEVGNGGDSDPVALWLRSNRAHYVWVCHFFYHLCREHTYRTGKPYARADLFKLYVGTKCVVPAKFWPTGGMQMEPVSFPLGTVPEQQQQYITKTKKHTWTRRRKPAWIP